VYKLTVPETLCNAYQSVHGGAISTIIDEFTTHAIFAADTKDRASVSLELSVSFLASAKQGDLMVILADCDKVGSQLGFASADVYCGDRLVAQGKHTKYMMNRPMIRE
jgi:acyl-coenzyme A thioesterase 13